MGEDEFSEMGEEVDELSENSESEGGDVMDNY